MNKVWKNGVTESGYYWAGMCNKSDHLVDIPEIVAIQKICDPNGIETLWMHDFHIDDDDREPALVCALVSEGWIFMGPLDPPTECVNEQEIAKIDARADE